MAYVYNQMHRLCETHWWRVSYLARKIEKGSQKCLFHFQYFIRELFWLQETVDSELSHDQVDDDDIDEYIDNMLAKSVAELVSMIQEHAELSLIDNYVMLRVQLVVA